MNSSPNRRQFLRQSALAAGGLGAWLGAGPVHGGLFGRKPQPKSPNDRLNIGVIGVANRGAANLKGVSGENIVAFCDVDANYLEAAGTKWPEARRYSDFRRLIDDRNVEAVVISTPDHTHAVAAMEALAAGKHVYCEKPLTHTVSEARLISAKARETGLATQMGNQIHASNNYRRVVELVQSGAIGDVSEVHVWVGGAWSPKPRPIEIIPIPSHLSYDLWLGPAQYRPYHPEYLPFNWRRWWAFGGGTLADFGCHYMDLPHWALNLRQPLTVEADGPAAHPECAPESLRVQYTHPARDLLPAVTLTWYHGTLRPALVEQGTVPKWGSGVLFVGRKGMLLADYSRHLLLPEKQFAGFQPPAPFIPDSIGHHAEWIQACKTGSPTTSNFDYAAALTETVLLGNVAHRLGRKIEWDSVRFQATNSPEAASFIHHDYRRGWRL